MGRFAFNPLFLLALSALNLSQIAPDANGKPEASAMLKQVSKKYAAARYYRVEAVEEDKTTGPFSRDWRKSVLTAINAPGSRYRFEVHAQFSQLLKVSDGKTESNYNFDSQEYTQQPTPAGGARSKATPMDLQQSELIGSLELIKNLSQRLNMLHAPEYLQDEDLALNGKIMSCYVIKGRPRYSGGSLDAGAEVTFWIDKQNLLVRKQEFHAAGLLFAAYSQHFEESLTIIYPVTDLDLISASGPLFSFHPPAGARLVQKFSDTSHPADKLAGTPSPAFKLQNTSGKQISLQDFHGRPVLLDFWATWCAPCVAALEPLKKLHEEIGKRLTILSIDEDEEADAGEKFFAEHKIPWTNFHDDGEVWRSFPGGQGIPFYVLIDANGQIAFSGSGAEDVELRAAITRLGIDLRIKEINNDAKAKQ